MEPETLFARLGDQRIAYQVLGRGPVDLVITPGRLSSIDAEWDEPETVLFYQRLAAFSRLVRYDMRGAGASDPVPVDALPPLESSVDELIAVMDAVGIERTVVWGTLDGGPAAMLAAVSRPERVSGLVLMHAAARYLVDSDYPIGVPPETVLLLDQMLETGITAEMAALTNPSKASDPAHLRRMQRWMRSVAGPSAVRAYFLEMLNRDVRSLLPAVRVPTLVIHRTDNYWIPAALGRYVAEHVDGADLVMVEGADTTPFYERPGEIIDAVRRFVGALSPSDAPVDRVMATVLFTDIVSSTERAQSAGDSEWMPLLEMHDQLSRRLVEDHLGKVVKTTGDGIMAKFDSPGRGLRGATALRDQLGRVGLPIRAGIHTGEVELRGDDLGGVGVHIAARVMGTASPGEILVSRTVKDLVVGSDFRFDDRGTHTLKGVEGDWQLFALAG